MTATEARTAAVRAKRSGILEVLTRIGFIGFGVTHLLVAWIAVQIALGVASADGDQDGAFRVLSAQPLGQFLLIVVAIGLVAMAVWQVLEAAVGQAPALERVASGFRALFYGYLAYAAYKVITHASETGAGKKEETAATVLSGTGGRWIVGLAGLVVLGVGVGLAVYGVIKRFEKHLRTGSMSAGTRKAVRALGIAGYVAKGVAYSIAGVLLISAAVTYDASKSRGLDAALHALARQPWGDTLLIVVAVGIAAFGVFGFVQARYRKV